MARKGRRFSSKPRMRADWVYRSEEFDNEGNPLGAQVASYVGLARNNGAYTLNPGSPLGFVLYDSSDYLVERTRLASTGSTIGREARSEGRGPTVKAVEGILHVMPNAWTIGSNFAIGMRLVICDQDLSTGGLSLPAAYNIFDVAPTWDTPPSVFANGWGNLATREFRTAFATGNEQQRWQMRLRWSGMRRLRTHECLGIYVESATPAIGSTTLLVTPRFRSLIHDPNS